MRVPHCAGWPPGSPGCRCSRWGSARAPGTPRGWPPTGNRSRGTILLGAPARTGEQVITCQIAAIAPALPAPARPITRLTRRDFAKTQRKRLALLKASEPDVIRVNGVRVNARWWREFLGYDPVPDYARTTAPVLAITGGHDMQVLPEDVQAIGRLVQGPFDGHLAGDLSHLLRPDPRPAGSLRLPACPPPAGKRRGPDAHHGMGGPPLRSGSSAALP